MDFKDKLTALAERVARQREDVRTEEATKTSFILPFLQVLGYDIFNPSEVRPEADCDYGTKKGEKIDYLISIDDAPVMLVECKHESADLDEFKAQLYRYYSVSKAKFGILTNGIVYKFFADLDKDNVMDDKPFFEVNLLDLKGSHIDKLKEFSRERYDTATILSSATEMKYVNAFRAMVAQMVQNPSDDIVRLFVKQVYNGVATQKILWDFKPLLMRAFQQYINDNVNDRLKSALTPDVPSVDKTKNEAPAEEQGDGRKIETTDEEVQGFYIVCAILCSAVDLERVIMRDAQSYCAILFDDNNRKPICRLHFNGSKKYVETFDANKVGTKHQISTLNDIYKLSSELVSTVKNYM
ncbi:MAG: type I restriction enzyme HsdR N-terminal domain-containing protein [Alistipes sp.]|nr:type I restriction enzyme HsdR N-terminal domain-containing protein [Alistipes sp.]